MWGELVSALCFPTGSFWEPQVARMHCKEGTDLIRNQRELWHSAWCFPYSGTLTPLTPGPLCCFPGPSSSCPLYQAFTVGQVRSLVWEKLHPVTMANGRNFFNQDLTLESVIDSIFQKLPCSLLNTVERKILFPIYMTLCLPPPLALGILVDTVYAGTLEVLV